MDVQPERPTDAGVAEREPEDMQIEGARLLANESKDVLVPKGFSEEDIRKWADAFIAEGHSGGVDEFVAWIEKQEKS